MTRILVTGCNRGIGAALTRAALARGWEVVGTVRDAAAVEVARRAFGDAVALRVCDMARVEGIADALAELPPLDVLVNNAGVIGPPDARQTPLSMDFAGFAETLAINAMAPLAVAQACLPALRARPGARILSVSSQMAWMGYAKSDRIAYRASKAALNKVMQGLATDLAPEGIAVGLVDPGWVRTEMGGPGAEEDPEAVARGILAIAARLDVSATGRFWRFTGEERAF